MSRRSDDFPPPVAASGHRRVVVSPISGFPEWLPAGRIAEAGMTDVIRATYERFGFTPIETPAVERLDVLTAKGGVQRQIYGLTRPDADTAKREEPALGLHFDLTVPTARYVVQHEAQLHFPLRRYQHQRVWRGERAQRGRFREFAQFDIDVIGRGSLDELHDAEILSVMCEALSAIGLFDASVHVSHRRVLSALTRAAGISDSEEILAVVDRAGRGGVDAAIGDLHKARVPPRLVDSIARLLACESLEEARKVLRADAAETDGLDALDRILDSAARLGVPAERLILDFSIARGLDYYTGMVVETFVPGHERWGSICSGGRYDNLASHFGRRQFPGVGVSIGVTRLFDLMVKAGRIAATTSSTATVLVTTPDRDRYLPRYLALARRLRTARINTEIYLEPRRLGDQLADAAAKGIPLVLIAGEREWEAGMVALKDMIEGSQREVEVANVEQQVATALARHQRPL